MNAKAKLAAKIGAIAAALAVGSVVVHEGYIGYVYRDPIGRLAVCFGHDDQTLVEGQKYTREECEALLAGDLLKHAAALDCFRGTLTDGQKAAVVSFAFNVGVRAVCRSTFAKLANAGRWPEACKALEKWVYAGGRKLPGLVKRRAAERAMCEGKA